MGLKVLVRIFRLLIPVLLIAACTEKTEIPQTTGLVTKDPARVVVMNFKTPAILFTAEELSILRTLVNSNNASLKKACTNLLIRCENGLGHTPVAYTGTDPLTFLEKIEGPGALARDLALGYNLSGENKYAFKSIQVMTKWAGDCKDLLYTVEPGTAMYLSRAVFPVICAYDLLKGSGLMNRDDCKKMEAWFRSIYPQIIAGIRLWYENDYYDKQDYNNHLVAHLMGTAATGFILQDMNIIQFALNSSSNPRDFYELISGLILMKGDPPCHREGMNVPAPENGEIYDRYRHITGPVRGLQYCHLSLTEMAIIARIFSNSGVNLFDYTAPGGENLRLPFEYYADFYRAMDSCIKTGFYCGENDRMAKAQDRPGLFELGYASYDESIPIRNLVNSGNYDRGSDYIPLLGYYRFFSGVADPIN